MSRGGQRLGSRQRYLELVIDRENTDGPQISIGVFLPLLYLLREQEKSI